MKGFNMPLEQLLRLEKDVGSITSGAEMELKMQLLKAPSMKLECS